MSKAEALAEAYHLTGSSLALLEMAVSDEEEVLKLPHALIERLNEDARPLGWQFVAAATFGPVVRLYYRDSDTLFEKNLVFLDDPALAIFRDLISHKSKLAVGGSV